MKKLSPILILLAIAIIAGCSSIAVTADWDKTVDFTQFKTYSYYGWAANSDQILNEFDKKRIEQAFAEEFEKVSRAV